MQPLHIAPDEPTRPDVRTLLQAHLRFAHTFTEHGDVYALDVEALLEPSIRFFSARREGRLLAVAALSRLDAGHVELKSMHTAAPARGQGVARALLEYLLEFARGQGYERMSLETGSMEAFEPARRLYRNLGFTPCDPLPHYPPSSLSCFMSRPLRTD